MNGINLQNCQKVKILAAKHVIYITLFASRFLYKLMKVYIKSRIGDHIGPNG